MLDGFEMLPEGLGVLGRSAVFGMEVSGGDEGEGHAIEGVMDGDVGDAVAGVVGEEEEGGVLLVFKRAVVEKVEEFLFAVLA